MSYGSLLGATAAAMFPNRMDRILLDGIVHAPNYYHHQGVDIDQLLGADAAAREILAQCILAGPSKCALASLNATTAADLETALLTTAAHYDATPFAPAGTVISGRTVLEILYTAAKYPGDIANAITHLANLVTGTNLTQAAAYHTAVMGGLAMAQDDALYGIKCGDTFPRADGVEGVVDDYEHMLGTSKLFGALASIVTSCAEWPWKAKERYGGPWEGIKTRAPVLFVGNTWDPATAMENAFVMREAFEGAVVLEQRGFGVSSFSISCLRVEEDAG
jgi:pimeloyl-ACP methyl ester carboxylesterase